MTWTRSKSWGLVDRPDDGEHGGSIYAADLESGEILQARGPSAIVLRTALSGQTLEQILQTTAQRLGVDLVDIDEEVAAEIIQDLVAVGLLVGDASA